jgi:hypothetical protein
VTISRDSISAVSRGAELLKANNIRSPRRFRINSEPRKVSAIALADSFSDEIILADDYSEEEARHNIETKFLAGSLSDPLASVIVHESTHLDHYRALTESMSLGKWKTPVEGADQNDIGYAAEVRWEQLTGGWDLQKQKNEAKAAGRVFRPAAGLFQRYAWSPDYRLASGSQPQPSAGEALDIAQEVSLYATTNPLEFVAEFRAGVLSGHDYSDGAWDLYESYAGPPLDRRRRQ